MQRIVISHAFELHTNDDIIVSPPEVKERVDVDSLFGGGPQKAKHRKELKSAYH